MLYADNFKDGILFSFIVCTVPTLNLFTCYSGKDYEAEAGDSWNMPGNVEHGVRVHEDSVVIEVFSPVREDYLP